MAGGADPIELRGIGYSYGAGELARPVLRDVDLSVGPGEIVLLTGPSGSGKATLLTLIGALRAVRTGSAAVLGRRLEGASERRRVALRRRIGFIFQQHNLLGFLSARQNVAMSLELDPASGGVVRLLGDLAKRRGVPILLVAHDPRILDIADRIAAMEDGRIASAAAGATAPG